MNHDVIMKSPKGDAMPHIVIVAEGCAEVVAQIDEDNFVVDAVEQEERDDKYTDLKHYPLRDQRFKANFNSKHAPRTIVLCDLRERQHFGVEYVCDLGTDFK